MSSIHADCLDLHTRVVCLFLFSTVLKVWDLHTGVVCLLLLSTVLKVWDFHSFVDYFLISTLHSGNAVCCFPHM